MLPILMQHANKALKICTHLWVEEGDWGKEEARNMEKVKHKEKMGKTAKIMAMHLGKEMLVAMVMATTLMEAMR